MKLKEIFRKALVAAAVVNMAAGIVSFTRGLEEQPGNNESASRCMAQTDAGWACTPSDTAALAKNAKGYGYEVDGLTSFLIGLNGYAIFRKKNASP